MAAVVSMLSRFRGALIGAVIGDCIGAKFEDQMLPCVKWEDLCKEVKLLESLSTGDDAFPYTDDTAMARSVAASLIENKAFDAHDMAERFTNEYFQEPDRGYGGNVVTVFEKLRQTQFEDVYAPASQQFGGSGSYGNGGAMRIAPVALFVVKFENLTALKELCEKSTRLTHFNNKGILGAYLQASAVDLALREKASAADLSCDTFLDNLIERLRSVESHSADAGVDSGPLPAKRINLDNDEIRNDIKLYTDKLSKMKDYLKAGKTDSEEIAKVFGNSISALGSVPTAIYTFLRAKDSIKSVPVDEPFKRSVLYAITMGGDTDTIASMTGAIAGAFYGMEAVPQIWMKHCEGVQEAIQQADALYKLSTEK